MPSVPRRPGRPSAEHQAAVTRRLELLRAELALEPVLHAVPDLEPGPASEDPPGAEPYDPWWSGATRIPGVVVPPDPLAAPPEPEVPAAPRVQAGEPVPLPGRHASRRRRDLVGAVVPETLRGRVVLGPSQLTVLAVLVCVGLAVLAWTVVRSRPEAVAPVLAAAVPSATTTDTPVVTLPGAQAPAQPVAATPAAPSGAAVGGSITVDVAGKVRRPGIAVLDSGARVIDAITAAGGARQGVDLTPLNLARPLVDGEQVVVGVDPPPGVAAAALGVPGTGSAAAGSAPAATGATGTGVLVDLNTATDAELDTLPDVGPVTAASIIAWRVEHGGFTTVDELLEVDGIGEATLTRLAPHVTV